MATSRRKEIRAKWAGFYAQIETLRKEGKHGQSISDPEVRGLSYQKQRTHIYARWRGMIKGTGKRADKTICSMPRLTDLTEQARAAGRDPLNEPSLKLEEVRGKARQLRQRARLGLSLTVPAHGTPNETPEEMTVADLAKRYLEGPGLKLKPKTLATAQSYAKRLIVPALGHMRVDVVKMLDVEVLHGSLSKTPFQANRVLSLLSTMFNWAMGHGWREGNPAKGIKHFPEKERERWLSEEELARLGEVLDRHKDDPSAQAIKMLALTGARKAEVLGAKWSEIEGLDGTEPTWTIPAIRTKKARMIVRHLDPETVALIKSIPKNGAYLFPSPKLPGKPLTDIKRAWRRIKQEAGIDLEDSGQEKAVIHTLRHTVASHIVSDGGELLTARDQLGQTSLKSTQRYAKLAPGKMRETMTAFGRS